jgi:hypothetical protein
MKAAGCGRRLRCRSGPLSGRLAATGGGVPPVGAARNGSSVTIAAGGGVSVRFGTFRAALCET